MKGNEIMKDLFIKFHNLKKIRLFKEKEKIELKNELDHLTNLENLAIERNDFEEAQAIENKIVTLNVWNPRDYTHDRHKTVDDRPFGGGQGMVMKYQPLHDAVTDAKVNAKNDFFRTEV